MADPSRTEAATPKKREELRRKGNIPKSREIPSAVVLLGGFLILYLCSGRILSGLSGLLRDYLSLAPGRLETVDAVHTALAGLMVQCAAFLGPFLAVTVFCAAAANIGQVGFLFTMTPLTPSLEKLSPAAGLARMFSPSSFAEMAKAIVKFAVVGFLAWRIIRQEIPRLPLIIDRTPMEVVAYMADISGTLLLHCGLALLVLAAADYVFQRWTYEKSIRMTKAEVKEEWRAQEGDPMVKGRIRSLQREKARRRILQEVPKADVVVTNPTHFAVALKYDRGAMAAPRVTAKGADLLARRIRELAAEHGVPVVERPPLARALYEAVDEGQEIPADFYRAVAEVLAYVYRLKDRRAV